VQTTSASLKLTSGTYAVTETKAPTGYKAAALQKFTVSDNGSVLVKGKTQQGRTVTLTSQKLVKTSGHSGHAATHHDRTGYTAHQSKTYAAKAKTGKHSGHHANVKRSVESTEDSVEDGEGGEKVAASQDITTIQPINENQISDQDKSSYITELTVDKTNVTSPEQIKVTASFSDGNSDNHVFKGGDTITINWKNSGDTYIQGYSKTIPLVSEDGVTYATAVIYSDHAEITFNNNVDNMYDVSGNIWFTALAGKSDAGQGQVKINGGNWSVPVTIIKQQEQSSSGDGDQKIGKPFRKMTVSGIRKEEGSLVEGTSYQANYFPNAALKQNLMSLNLENPTYTTWGIYVNEDKDPMNEEVTIIDTIAPGQQLAPDRIAEIYSHNVYEHYIGSLQDVVSQWNKNHTNSFLEIDPSSGKIIWMIDPKDINENNWNLVFTCNITDFSLPYLTNSAVNNKGITESDVFQNASAGGDITALPRGVLQITKKIKGTEQTVSGVTFQVEKQNRENGDNWESVGTITTNKEGGIATMTGLTSGDYRVCEASHPIHLNGDFTVENNSITYVKGVPYYKFSVDSSKPNGIAITAADSIRTMDITAIKEWKGDNNSHHPEVSFQLYRKTEKTSRYTAVSEPEILTNGKTSVTWNNMPEYTVTGKPYTYYVKEVRVPEGYTSNDDYVKVVNGTATITNTYTKPSQDTGSLKLTKTSSGHDTPDDAEFTITGTRPNNYSRTVKYSELTNGSITLSNLPIGTYTVTESKADIDGYSLNVTGDRNAEVTKDGTAELKLTNAYTPNTPVTPITPTPSTPKTSVKVTKDWIGGQESSAVVHLLADGKVVATETLNAQNGWTHTFTDLDKQAAGHDIVYTVSEDQITGYTSKITGDAANGFMITNTKDQPVTPITPTPSTPKTFVKVTKNWVGGQESSAVIHLLADGNVIKTETLNAQNGWTHTFTDLDKQVASHDVVYTVSEDQITGYTSKISGDAANGFVITNTKDQPEKPDKPSKPDTPDTPTPSKPENHSGNNTPSHSKNTGNHSGQNTQVNPSSSTVDNHQTVKPMTPAAAKTAVSGNHAAASANIPKTGDETDLSLYAFLLGGAAALLAVILVLKSRREN
jgi:hypothetical protein